MEEIKHYKNEDITVVWKPTVCTHSKNCWKKDIGLPEVFNPTVKPWININGATTEKIIAQIKKCPSGALSYISNKETP